ncbi:glutamate--tRNA ligase [Tepidamorphus sp. 3E244]|uniref:glutamate--tRNA ligase n=1 Tax=Tepidamorphus sp. 3E244 TaxID=3385498 RepID=UPI0038FD2A51
MSTTVRFAPSPTGKIHIGNARTALLNWLYAKATGGRFILRFDDTDTERSREEYVEAIRADLEWLGIEPDMEVRQSDRLEMYDAAAERLKAEGKLYPAYETADELEKKRKRQRARRLPPLYDRAALDLGDDERAALEAEGRKPHWRFLLERAQVRWEDGVRGEQMIDTAAMSDPVLIRADGSYLYTLTSIVDDIDLGVTHVIRGEDHVANTGIQYEIFRALGAEPPTFAHHNLLVDADGNALSKRLGSLSIEGLREAGFEPQAVAALALLIGTSLPVEPVRDLAALAGSFDLSVISRSPARFDPAELDGLNARLLHEMTFDDIAPRLQAAGIDTDEALWAAVSSNLSRFEDIATWQQIVADGTPPLDEGLELSEDDRAYLAQAADALPPEPWDGETWKAWTQDLKVQTGRKGRGLFLPLRVALTGRASGPEMAALLPLIGSSSTAARLRERAC